MFNGATALNLDAKGRLAIPTRLRERLTSVCGGRVVVTHHPFDECLSLYPEQQWQDIARKVSNLPDADRGVRFLKRRFLGQAQELELDGSGRCLIPGELREMVGLEKKVMLVGLENSFEIWSEAGWQQQFKDNEGLDQADMPESVTSLAF